MKKATNRILSFLTAFAMVIGVLVAPLTSANAADETGETTPTKAEDKVTNHVTLHKLIMKKDELSNWSSDALEKAGYNGTQDTDALKALLDEGHSANEVAGVYFAFKYNDGSNKGKYVTIKEEEGKAPVYGAVDSLDDKLEKGVKLLAGKTEDNGIEFNTKGLKGNFLIEEIHEKSSYVGKDGEAITDSKAVPVEITLPLVNNDGVVEEAHVYPKNTEEKPQIDKNFKKDNNVLTNAEGNFDEYYTDEEKTAGAQTGDINHGADYNNYNKKKLIANGEIGKNIPYEVKTKIPAKSNLKLAKWDDNMSAGLTYNKDLKLTIADKEIKNTEETTYYTIKETDSGFVLRLEEAGLDLVNNKDEAVEVKLVYSATVNSDAIADIPETNDVKFNYGNNPSKETEPKSTKPSEGKITVEKTWDNGSDWEEGEYAIFKLVDATTGREVTADDLVGDEKDETFKKYKENFKSTVKLSKDTTATHTWEYLDGEKEYTAIEIESKTLSDAEYTEAADGTIKVTNHKSNNPKPLNPTEPKVVLGGKKFVKTNQDGKERLAGAEFYVKNAEGKYLVADQTDATKVTKAKEALDEAVKAYNALDADKQTAEEKAKVTAAQEAYNKAFKENATAYKWEDANTNAVVLTSDGQGKFEISGLEYGSYKLEEKTAPKGYAKLNGEIDFKVAKGTYNGDASEFKYEVEVKEGEKQTYGKQVPNKKVSIPQTGGIGSLIFIVAGLAIMGVAFVAMKKRNAVEA